MTLSRIALPAVVLGVFGLALPVSLPDATSDVSAAECRTLADRAPEPRPNSIDTLERCSALYPDDVELLADLGAQYESVGAARQAEAAYQRALTLQPGDAEVRLRLGRLLLQRGAAADARRHAEAALRVQPNRRPLLDVLEEASRMSHAVPR